MWHLDTWYVCYHQLKKLHLLTIYMNNNSLSTITQVAVKEKSLHCENHELAMHSVYCIVHTSSNKVHAYALSIKRQQQNWVSEKHVTHIAKKLTPCRRCRCYKYTIYVAYMWNKLASCILYVWNKYRSYSLCQFPLKNKMKRNQNQIQFDLTAPIEQNSNNNRRWCRKRSKILLVEEIACHTPM